ncbi:SRPBCC domain-containing protein [Propionicicella superfundia]|uniref:SRPBCC domain-containing protein n=1 Tax=Propionicicella superfundia TaxID=348582 RepID=UPI00042818C7|nr:SRPBCC domain-containing protein [Propionicicella superfundia]
MSQLHTEETTDTSNAVVVSRLVQSSVKEVWRRLVSDEGANAILGEGGVLGDKGHSWRAADGTYGVVRSYHPLEQIRFSWHAHDGAPGSMVDLRMTAEGEAGTTVEVRHDRLGPDTDPSEIQRRWEEALDRF